MFVGMVHHVIHLKTAFALNVSIIKYANKVLYLTTSSVNVYRTRFVLETFVGTVQGVILITIAVALYVLIKFALRVLHSIIKHANASQPKSAQLNFVGMALLLINLIIAFAHNVLVLSYA
jgi:hypothetical protein